MGAAVPIVRLDLTARQLRQVAGAEKNGAVARRLLALALVLDGVDRKSAAQIGGMDRQTLRDWVHRYNSEGLSGLGSLKPLGRSSKLTAQQRAVLAELVETGPDPARHGVVAGDGLIYATSCSASSVSPSTNGRSASSWPSSATAGCRCGRVIREPMRHLKKLCRKDREIAQRLPDRAAGKPIEIWFQVEARIGQQGTLIRVWAKRGSRPRAPRYQRYDWSYLFGATCAQRRVAAGLVLPAANTETMSLLLAAISSKVAPDSHAALVIGGAGYHTAGALAVPDNITLVRMPPYAPEPRTQSNREPLGIPARQQTRHRRL